MPNYGDVALDLKADWDRNAYENNSDWMLYTVGHSNGEPDVYKTDEPWQRFQFRWVDFRDHSEVTKAEMQHYEWVKKDSWTKHPILWQWDAEGYCHFAGQRLMARPEEYWIADQRRRENLDKQDRDRDDEMAPKGLIRTDKEGKPIKPRKRGI